MLWGLRRLFGRARDPHARLAAVEERLARGWTYKAYQELLALAEGGLSDAQFRLGRMYETAEGVVQNLGDAVHWYRRAAEQGHSGSQSRLGLIFFAEPPAAAGVMEPGIALEETPGADAGGGVLAGSLGAPFEHGFGVKQDLAEAAKWNRLAADAGEADAQARYGHQLAMGTGVEQDLAAAERYFRSSAQQDFALGQAALGILLAGGYAGAQAREEEARSWLEQAAAKGNSAAQYWLGQLKLRGAALTEQARKEGIKLLRRAAAQGQTGAMYGLGMTYWRGDGAKPDMSAAETWMRRAATKGNIVAKRSMAQLLLERSTDNGVEAAAWLLEAAQAGDRQSAALLAELFLRGHGVRRDLVEAARWLGAAGGEARPEAFVLLASFHAQGVGGPQNLASAAEWLHVAAQRGSIAAQFNLGSLHWQGKGVPRDPVEALAWFSKAAQAGNVQAAFYLGLLYADESCALHSYPKAAYWFRRARDGGHGLGLCNLALLMLQGKGVRRDVSRAIRLLESGAASGCVQAAELLFSLYSTGEQLAESTERAVAWLRRAVALGSRDAALLLVEAGELGYGWPMDREQTRNALEPEAKRGNAACQRALGQLLLRWNPDKPDPRAAASWFQSAAKAGDAQAQAWMGDCEREGLLGKADAQEAERWYRSAAGKGHLGALVQLARLAEQGPARGPESESECFGLWLAAAASGNPEAQRCVGERYLAGRGCAMNDFEAARWLGAAAEQGDARAQLALGRCYRDGRGLAKDPGFARLWLERAARQGLDEAQSSRAAAGEAGAPDATELVGS
jgi:hypothetical protein